MQLPASQRALRTFARRPQSLPQRPQLAGSLKSASQPFTVRPSQSARPLPHTNLHIASSQLDESTFGSDRHTFSQAPQVSGKLKSDSQPSESCPLQSPRPSMQVVIRHSPLLQLVSAFGAEHGRPQPLQSFTVRMSTSQPFDTSRSQSL